MHSSYKFLTIINNKKKEQKSFQSVKKTHPKQFKDNMSAQQQIAHSPAHKQYMKIYKKINSYILAILSWDLRIEYQFQHFDMKYS